MFVIPSHSASILTSVQVSRPFQSNIAETSKVVPDPSWADESLGQLLLLEMDLRFALCLG